MSKVEMARAFVNQRLTAAAEEIFGLFERTIAEYEEELCRSKEKNERQQKLLDAVLKPEVRLHRADIQQLLVKEEVPPEQLEWSPSLDQEDPPEPPHIKEEQEELWTSQEGEQLQGLEEADITKFLFTPVPVKSDDDEEKPQSSQLHQRQTEQMETGADGEDCGGPEPARNSHPDPHLQTETKLKAEDFSVTEDGDNWEETSGPQSGLKPVKNEEEEKRFSCSECGKKFRQHSLLTQHEVIHTGEKRYSCSVCELRFTWRNQVRRHKCLGPGSSHLHPKEQTEENRGWEQMGTGEKPFSCLVCGKVFKLKGDVKKHIPIHTGEKKFSCLVCSKGFIHPSTLSKHMRTHSGEKPFSCSVCGKSFKQSGHLTCHMLVHTREKPFGCSVCGTKFTQKGKLTLHMVEHTPKKRFSCNVCDQRFTGESNLRNHKRVCRRSSRLDQEDPPEPPHIKEEQEELWTSQEGEQLQGLEEADITKFLFTPVPVKSEDDEETPQSSQLHQRQTEQMERGADGEDCGGPEPARTSHPDPHLQPETEVKTEEDSSETEDSDDWEETSGPQSDKPSTKQ